MAPIGIMLDERFDFRFIDAIDDRLHRDGIARPIKQRQLFADQLFIQAVFKPANAVRGCVSLEDERTMFLLV